MICNTCRQTIPDNLLGPECPGCVIKRNDRALREYQYTPLLKVADGRAELTIHRTKDGIAHAQMFGSESHGEGGCHWVAFCGEPVSTPRNKRKYIGWDADEFNRLCAKCRIELKAALREAREAHMAEP